MAKPLPRRVPSDDCAVTVDGTVYYPHEGEWVEMFTSMSIAEMHGLDELGRLGVKLDSVKGEIDEYARTSQLLNEYFDEVCVCLAHRIVRWNWTDDAGRPLEQPDGKPSLLKRLRDEELRWLFRAGQGETAAARKNA